jgi:Ran GTPase-activating protein 1
MGNFPSTKKSKSNNELAAKMNEQPKAEAAVTNAEISAAEAEAEAEVLTACKLEEEKETEELAPETVCTLETVETIEVAQVAPETVETEVAQAVPETVETELAQAAPETVDTEVAQVVPETVDTEEDESIPLVSETSIAGMKLKLNSAVDVRSQVDEIKAARGLKLVNLSGNTIGLDACKALAAALESKDDLEEVNISDCFTGRLKEDVPPAIEEFGRILAGKPKLRIVDFSDNAFSPAGAKALNFFLANCVSLEELRLNNNGLGPVGGQIIAQGLLDNRAKTREQGMPSSLKCVTIGRNRLENGSAALFAEAFKSHEGLREVAMYQNGIRPEGIKMLAEGLAACSELSVVDLTDNTFSEMGSMAFAEAVGKWSQLTQLLIGDCLFGNDGCKRILEELAKSPACGTLQVLNLQYSEMESNTALYLANILPKFTALQSLAINGNCFSSEGEEVKAIKDALESIGKNPVLVLDELDDMDYEDEEDEDEDEEKEDEEEEEKEKEDNEEDDESVESGESEKDKDNGQQEKVAELALAVECLQVATEVEAIEKDVDVAAADAMAEVTAVVENLNIEADRLEKDIEKEANSFDNINKNSDNN